MALLPAAAALGADATFRFTDARLQAEGTRWLSLFPIAVYEPSGMLVASDQVTVKTGTNSSVTVSNLLGGFWRAEFSGTWRTTTNWFMFPTNSLTVDAADYRAMFVTNGPFVSILSPLLGTGSLGGMVTQSMVSVASYGIAAPSGNSMLIAHGGFASASWTPLLYEGMDGALWSFTNITAVPGSGATLSGFDASGLFNVPITGVAGLPEALEYLTNNIGSGGGTNAATLAGTNTFTDTNTFTKTVRVPNLEAGTISVSNGLSGSGIWLSNVFWVHRSPFAAQPKRLVITGDSLAESTSYGYSWPSNLMQRSFFQGGPLAWTNIGQSGAFIQAPGGQGSVLSLYPAYGRALAGTNGILIDEGGVNDLCYYTPDQLWAYKTQFWAMAKADGFRVMTCTIAPANDGRSDGNYVRTNGGIWESNRLAFNALIRTNTLAHGVIDLAAVPLDTENTTTYRDKVHFAAQGCALLGTYADSLLHYLSQSWTGWDSNTVTIVPVNTNYWLGNVMLSITNGLICGLWPYDANASNYMTSAGLAEKWRTPMQIAIRDLKLSGIWDVFTNGGLYFAIGGTSNSHAINLMTASSNITWFGNLATAAGHTTNGIACDGTTGYGNTWWTASATNSLTMFIYARTNENGTFKHMLGSKTSAYADITTGSSQPTIFMNDNTGYGLGCSWPLFAAGCRTNASGWDGRVGDSSDYHSIASTGNQTYPVFIGACNNSGTANYFAQATVQAFGFSTNRLTLFQMMTLRTIIERLNAGR